MEKEKILVHICCGVDAVWALRKLKEEFPGAQLKGYFYDPNIHPQEEYELRWIETKRVCDDLGIECEKGEYDVENWLKAVRGLENEPERGARCTVCHDIRLEKSAQFAKENGFNKFTTVLMMSPKKDFEVLTDVGTKIAQKYGLEFLPVEFRKGGGVEKMNKLSKEMQLYHQNYCGCIYGLFQQRKDLEYVPELVKFSKEILPGSTEEKLTVKQIRTFAESLGIHCEEEEFNFINWKVLQSVVKINKEPVFHEVLPYSTSIRGVLRDRVKTIKDEGDKKVLTFVKSNVKVWMVDDIKTVRLEKPRYITDPVFVVEKMDVNVGDKFEFQLKTEFDPAAKTQILFVGNLNGEKLQSKSVDKLDVSEVLQFIEKSKEKLQTGFIEITPSEILGKLV